jgi:hypothetical protein
MSRSITIAWRPHFASNPSDAGRGPQPSDEPAACPFADAVRSDFMNASSLRPPVRTQATCREPRSFQ